MFNYQYFFLKIVSEIIALQGSSSYSFLNLLFSAERECLESIPNKCFPNYLDNTELIDIKVKFTNLHRTNNCLGKITQVKPVSDNFFVPDY